MKIQNLLENWGLKGLQLNVGFLKLDWEPQPDEQQAAWELYVEILTRVTTQLLPDADGDEEAALKSVHNLFEITRKLLKQKGRKAQTFSKIAIVILNQKIRPFTAEWHKKSLAGVFDTPEGRQEFRKALKEIQNVLRGYAGLLSEIAGVEDFQGLSQGPVVELQ